jgi:Trypsin-like serine proteases, typically periplasmic, contain C-terminal PDZ domain
MFGRVDSPSAQQCTAHLTLVELIVDIVLALTAVGIILVGWRRGAMLTALSMVGLVAGLWLGLQLAPVVVGWTANLDWSTPLTRTLIAALVVLVCSSVVYGAAGTLGAIIRRHLGRGVARGVDAAGGAVVALVAWAAVIWLIAGFAQTTGVLPLSQIAASSKIVAALDAVAPIPAQSALGALDDALGAAGLPEVFSGGRETIRAVPAPDPAIPAAVDARAKSVVKVLALEPRCGTESSGTGWVVTGDRVMTNAHVVAGSSSVGVQVPGSGTLRAQVVVYDPERDLAILDVPGLSSPALPLGSEASAGQSTVIAGYPGGGPYTLDPARVRQVLDATGTDIYRHGTVVREIYSLRGTVRPGNSGGPLFDTSGRVVGVVFARSTTDASTGYALTLREIAPVLSEANATTTVGTGGCTSE